MTNLWLCKKIMKIRTDFVTNSSSSSFVIAHLDEGTTIDKETLKKYPFLKNYNKIISLILRGMDQADFSEISNEDDLIDYLYENYDWQRTQTVKDLLSNEYALETYEKYKKYLDKGYKISFLSVPKYADYTQIELLHSIEENNKDFIILEQCD